jgi:hypothetical protein
VACVGIDQDSSWRFLPVVSNDLTPIGGRNPRLPEAVAAEVKSIVTVMPVTRMSLTPRLKRVWRRINKAKDSDDLQV